MLDGIGVGVSLGVEMHHVAGAEPCWRCDVVVRVSSCDEKTLVASLWLMMLFGDHGDGRC